MAAPPPPRCDDYARVSMWMQRYQYPGWVPHVPNAAPYDCSVNRRLCQNKRLNNNHHPIPPNGAMVGGLGIPTTRNRTVCDNCHTQAHNMAQVDRFFADLAGVTTYEPAEPTVFCDDGTNHAALVAAGMPPGQLELGVHHLGRLCRRCQNTEIQRYWERRFSGVRRQTAAKAGNTCKCEAFLRKRLCYEDRVTKLHQIRHASVQNRRNFLRWLYRDPHDNNKLKLAVNPPARAFVWAVRHMNPADETNACRCGRAVPVAEVMYGLVDSIPTPAAMCTACDGIVIDLTHPLVTGWANRRRPLTLPPQEHGNLTLSRHVERA